MLDCAEVEQEVPSLTCFQGVNFFREKNQLKSWKT